MSEDVERLIGFYKSPLGGIAQGLLGQRVVELAGDLRGKRVIGLGYATPYLDFACGSAERVMAFMPARQGAARWPEKGPSATVLCDPLEMPLTDSAVDLIIAIHAFEHVADASELMRELWRVAATGARLIAVVPRRRGLWAQRDNTPFGTGNPFSGAQIEKLLRDHSFTPEIWRDALFLPPVEAEWALRWSRGIERAGRLLGPALAGVTIVRARKELVPAVPRRLKVSRLVRMPELTPQPALHLPERM